MNSIKYRVWDIENNRWLNQLSLRGRDSCIKAINGIEQYFTPETSQLRYYQDETKFKIQKNTGHYDDAGKEIYFGDILKNGIIVGNICEVNSKL